MRMRQSFTSGWWRIGQPTPAGEGVTKLVSPSRGSAPRTEFGGEDVPPGDAGNLRMTLDLIRSEEWGLIHYRVTMAKIRLH